MNITPHILYKTFCTKILIDPMDNGLSTVHEHVTEVLRY